MSKRSEEQNRPAGRRDPARTGTWTGTWVAERLGVGLEPADARTMLGLAVRRNPRRAHLLVSHVLGKHVPAAPRTVHGAGLELGRRVRELLLQDGPDAASGALVLGFAETATALGHSAADGLGAAVYLHSTRRPVDGVRPVGGFEEEHSHATSHLLLPSDPGLLAGDGPLVLVDDELSTGRTVRNTLRALHAVAPRRRYVVAALADMRPADAHGALRELGAELGARIDAVALCTGRAELPADVLERGAALVAEVEGAAVPAPRLSDETAPEVSRVDLGWPAGLPDGGRHGFTAAHRARLDAALPALGARLADAVRPTLPAEGGRVLVLGFEELMYAPLRLAEALETQLDGADVRFSTTTRSPVLPVDDPGYAIRTRLEFPAHDNPGDGPGPRYAYNVAPGAHGTRFDTVVAVVDSAADTPELHTPGGLLDRLRTECGTVLLAAVPAHRPLPAPLRGPAFSSYPAADVGWLLTDLSDVELEAPTEEREEAVQNGGAHYAESLPIEYRPSDEYQALYRSALDASAARVARAVGTVTELVLAERGRGAVLASLARAGTPVGVLMRRWALRRHGLDLPHYTLSIVRGRGIDPVALRWLADRHGDPSRVVFVDGWTGKGAITRELAAALEARPEGAGFDPSVAVLADPGSCVRTFGTREDYLIPSACLNSTVSGLVSRTVLRPDLIGPDTFHGAKFYRELADADVSAGFLAAVEAHFDTAAEDAARDAERLAADPAAREPDWTGWAEVERISRDYGIGDVNLVKPGVGETTRVLLRRVPWRILVRRGAGADLGHVRLLAEQRGVPVEEVDGLTYTCVGLIHPRYTRGATGADGQAAAAPHTATN